MLRSISKTLPTQNTHRKEPTASDLKFKTGEILKGTVIRKYPDGEVLVSARGKEFRAFSDINLTENSTHRFQVKRAGTNMELKVLDRLVQKLGSPLQLWSSNRTSRSELSGIISKLLENQNIKGLPHAFTERLAQLQKLFPAIIYGSHVEGKTQWVSRFIMGNGMFWENKVLHYLMNDKNQSLNKLMISDLKGMLLTLKNELGLMNSNNEQLDSLSEGIQNALHLIEQDQILNLSSMRDGIGWFFFIPGFKEEGFNSAELFVENKKHNEEICFSILLDFTVLGQMMVNVSLLGEIINVKINVTDEEKAHFITENIPLLERALQDKGLITKNITCNIGDTEEMTANPFLSVDGPSVHIVI